jgi:membrane protein implicated in regulation of membrane protease activity
VPTITLPTEDLVFVLAALLGGGLLLLTVVLDDALGRSLGGIRMARFSIDGTSIVPPLLAFVAMFGVGGIVAGRALGLESWSSVIVGAGFGLVGFAVGFVLFRTLQRSKGAAGFTTGGLVGHQGAVTVTIRSGQVGKVAVRAGDQTHEVSATSTQEITIGTVVKVVGTAGPGVVVERLMPQPIVMPAPPSPPAGDS